MVACRAPHGRVDRNAVIGSRRVSRHVAPRTGAWIETRWYGQRTIRPRVAPRTGAWIETSARAALASKGKSRPARARGSKLHLRRSGWRDQPVAPRTGAWIETPIIRASSRRRTSRAPHGRVDRNFNSAMIVGAVTGRAPHGRVDRNKGGAVADADHRRARRAPHGRVDRNCTNRGSGRPPNGRAPHGRVDRNFSMTWPSSGTLVVAPRTGAWIETSRPCRQDVPWRVAPRTGAWIETGL